MREKSTDLFRLPESWIKNRAAIKRDYFFFNTQRAPLCLVPFCEHHLRDRNFCGNYSNVTLVLKWLAGINKRENIISTRLYIEIIKSCLKLNKKLNCCCYLHFTLYSRIILFQCRHRL